MMRLGSDEVLVVDDRGDTMATLLEALWRTGARPYLVKDYEIAVEVIGRLQSWSGFGLIDLHLPSRQSDDVARMLGLELGRLIRRRFGESAKFAYITVMRESVSLADYRFGEATSGLGVIDKFRMHPHHLADAIALEMGIGR